MQHTFQQKDLAMIRGPPGTGKTRTLVEIIRQELRTGGKVLFSAASNTAVDNMCERLQAVGMKIIRWVCLGKCPVKLNNLLGLAIQQE